MVEITGTMPTGRPRAKSGYENRMVAIFALAGGVAALDVQSLFFFMPHIVADMGLSDQQVGVLSSAVLIGWSLAAFVFGQLSDRMGKRKPFLIWAMLAMAVLSGVSAVAAGYVGLMIARLLMGVAEGPVIPVKHAIVMAESTPSRRGLNMGIVQNFGAQLLGTLLGPIIMVMLAAQLGWRASFLVAGIPALICAALIWRYIREPEVAAHAAAAGPKSSVLEVLKTHNVWLSIVVSTASVCWFFVMLSFLPLLLTRHYGFSPETMSYVMSMLGLAGVISSFLGPAFPTARGGARRWSCSRSSGCWPPSGRWLPDRTRC